MTRSGQEEGVTMEQVAADGVAFDENDLDEDDLNPDGIYDGEPEHETPRVEVVADPDDEVAAPQAEPNWAAPVAVSDDGSHASFQPKRRPRPTFDVNEHHFVCHRMIPPEALVEWERKARAPQDPEADPAQPLTDLFRLAMDEAEVERFLEVVRNPDEGVDIEVLSGITQHLLRTYTNRPFPKPSPSSGGPRLISDTSTGG